jgi:hypothetical protein
MLTIRTFSGLFLSWLAAGSAIAGPISASEFHSKVIELYSFEPQKLDSAQMKAKSDQLDQFWSAAKADPQNTLPLLKRELEDPSNSAFFFYDASKLLLSLSKDRTYQALALRSIAKADLQGIQPADYLRTVHWFAGNDFDVREAAFRILAVPEFKAFIAQHSLTLGQDYSLICMLFPMDETIFVDDLAGRLATERNVQTQKSLLLALWYTVMPAGNTAMKKFADRGDNSPEATAYARALMDRKAGPGSISLSSAQSLREERREVMQRPISDEALMEFDQLTSKLLAKQ